MDIYKIRPAEENQIEYVKSFKLVGVILLFFCTFSLNAQLGFGNNSWNVNCYNDLQVNANTRPTLFMGSYTQRLDVSENYGFNTTRSWGTGELPSDATAFNNANGEGTDYVGLVTDAGNKEFAYIHKRKGFPPGKYKLTLRQWDDNTHVFIDDIHRPFSGENGWGSERMLVNCFELHANSTIEVITGNTGGGISQAILDIVKTDVLLSEEVDSEEVCDGNEVVLNGKVSLGVASVNHDLYALNFETGSNTYTSSSASHWSETASVGNTGSGSNYLKATAPSNGLKWVKFGPFSTMDMMNLVMSFRQFYLHINGTSAKVQISLDNSSWTDLSTWTGNTGNNTMFSPVLTSIPVSYEGKTSVYIQFLYENTETDDTGGSWSFDDILITGDGPASISYLWTPATGLSDPTVATPTVTITGTETYTVAVTVGNCTVTNDVVINMTEVPGQPSGALIQSAPGNAPNLYSVDDINGVIYTWSTNPGTNVGVFPNGNIGNPIEFIPTGEGDLVVTPSNACGTGTSFVFGNPLPVTLTKFFVDCDEGLTIYWTTASEQNSDYFVIEKSRDFESWIEVATRTAAGNSNHQNEYSQVDESPGGGVSYYRLKQVDFNGTEKIYDPVSANCNVENDKIMAYSTPSKNKLTVQVVSSRNKVITQLQVIDLSGKIVAAQDLRLIKGENEVSFNLANFGHGVYIVRLDLEVTTMQPIKVFL